MTVVYQPTFSMSTIQDHALLFCPLNSQVTPNTFALSTNTFLTQCLDIIFFQTHNTSARFAKPFHLSLHSEIDQSIFCLSSFSGIIRDQIMSNSFLSRQFREGGFSLLSTPGELLADFKESKDSLVKNSKKIFSFSSGNQFKTSKLLQTLKKYLIEASDTTNSLWRIVCRGFSTNLQSSTLEISANSSNLEKLLIKQIEGGFQSVSLTQNFHPESNSTYVQVWDLNIKAQLMKFYEDYLFEHQIVGHQYNLYQFENQILSIQSKANQSCKRENKKNENRLMETRDKIRSSQNVYTVEAKQNQILTEILNESNLIERSNQVSEQRTSPNDSLDVVTLSQNFMSEIQINALVEIEISDKSSELWVKKSLLELKSPSPQYYQKKESKTQFEENPQVKFGALANQASAKTSHDLSFKHEEKYDEESQVEKDDKKMFLQEYYEVKELLKIRAQKIEEESTQITIAEHTLTKNNQTITNNSQNQESIQTLEKRDQIYSEYLSDREKKFKEEENIAISKRQIAEERERLEIYKLELEREKNQLLKEIQKFNQFKQYEKEIRKEVITKRPNIKNKITINSTEKTENKKQISLFAHEMEPIIKKDKCPKQIKESKKKKKIDKALEQQGNLEKQKQRKKQFCEQEHNLTTFLDKMVLDDLSRVSCNIEDKYKERWMKRLQKLKVVESLPAEKIEVKEVIAKKSKKNKKK